MAGSGDVVAPGDDPLPPDNQSYQPNVDPMESLPRLAAVIERQRRELALARADAQGADIAAISAACASVRATVRSRRWRSITAASLGKLSMGSTLSW